MTPARRPTAARAGLYAAVLFLSWNHNLLGLPDRVGWGRDAARWGNLGSESHLVVARAARPDLPPLHPMGFVGPDGAFHRYPSQVGLPGIVLAATGLPPHLAAPGTAAVAALAVGAVLAGGQRWLGPPAGDAACALAAASPVFLPFAPSLYWALGLMLLPFALVWCLAPAATTRGRRLALAAAVGLAALAKCLCGYEYVTCVVAGPVAALWFHQHRLGVPLRMRIAAAAGLVGVGLAGFAGAMGLHVAQHEFVLGTDGVAAIRDRAAARVAADPGGEVKTAGTRLGFAVDRFRRYFDQPALAVAGGFGRVRWEVPLKWVAAGALALALAVAAGPARARLPREAVALAGAVALGFAASVSWQVLAVNHMVVHEHLNLVVFAVPFLPLAYLAVGHAAGLLVGSRVGPAALAAVLATMAANAATAPGLAAADAADQRAAEAAVAAWLDAPRPPDPRVGGAVDSVRPAAHVPAALLVEYGWLDAATGGPADPDGRIAAGWVVGDPRRTTRPTTRVVAVAGGRVVACEQLRFRRPDIEMQMRQPVPGGGFVVRVPAAAGGPLRLFGVGRDGAVSELRGP
jgi:hypothetical protein